MKEKNRNSPANANPLKCTLRMRIGKLRQQINGNASNVTVNKVDSRLATWLSSAAKELRVIKKIIYFHFLRIAYFIY